MTAAAGPPDWNGVPAAAFAHVQLNDETLRDGLQGPSAIDPPTDAKIRLLHLMVQLGIEAATLGFPAAGPRMRTQCRALAREAADEALPIALGCVARALPADVEPIAALQQECGRPVEATLVLGSSPVRMAAEGWSVDGMRRQLAAALQAAAHAGVPTAFMLEDAARTPAATLEPLCREAIAGGARRLVLADSAGHALPHGAAALVQWTRAAVIGDAAIALDWHGHRDRGLGVACALAAAEAGADRLHGTALGVGERAGNTEMDQLLVNLRLLGRTRGDLVRLPEYCRLVSHTLGVRIPAHYPVAGSDAFRVSTGIHAAALLKALARGDRALADQLLGAVPPSLFGLAQRVEVSPMSGRASIRHWLGTHGHDPDDVRLQQALLVAAKRADRALSTEECEFALRNAAAPGTDVRH